MDQIQDGGRLSSWKISSGHMSATDYLIHFMLGSRVEFSTSVDRMALLTVGENRNWKMSNGHISAVGYAIHFGSMAGLSSRRIKCLYFRLDQIQDHGRKPSCIILNLRNSSSDPIHIWFYGKSIGENNV